MSLRVIEHYLHEDGLPSWPGNGTPFGAIGGHSSESAAGEQALWDVLAWMVATAEQRGASYHEYHAWTPERPDDYLVVKAIPASRAAGSVGIGDSLALDDWARACLKRSGNAGDPNQGIYAVCIVGKSTVIRDIWSKDPRFLRPLHQRLLQIREESRAYQPQLPLDRIVEHFRVNPTTRSDWGRLPKNLTLEQRKAPATVRTAWHAALSDALGATRSPIPDVLPGLTTPEADDAMSALITFQPIVNRYAVVQAGATPRRTPAFDPADYDGNAIRDPNGKPIREPNNRQRVAIGWVEGTNLTLADGTVVSESTRWLMTASDSNGAIFYHEQDVVGDLIPIERVEGEDGTTIAELEEQRDRALQLAGSIRTEAATELDKLAIGAGDLKAGASAAASRIRNL